MADTVYDDLTIPANRLFVAWNRNNRHRFVTGFFHCTQAVTVTLSVLKPGESTAQVEGADIATDTESAKWYKLEEFDVAANTPIQFDYLMPRGWIRLLFSSVGSANVLSGEVSGVHKF